jgi:hypothetical protein
MNNIVEGSQREDDVDDNWLRPPIFLFYLLRDSTTGNDYNHHRQLDNYANVTQPSLLGLLPSDVLLLADDGPSTSTTSVPIEIFNRTLSTFSVIFGGAEGGDNDSSSVPSDVMDTGSYNGSDYDGTDNDLSENYSSPYLMPWPQRTSWIAIFTLMLFVAIVGNTLVAWIVLGQSPSCMLATSDLLQMLHRLFVLFMLLIIQLY